MRKSIIVSVGTYFNLIDVSNIETSAVSLDYTIPSPSTLHIDKMDISSNKRFIAMGSSNVIVGGSGTTQSLNIFDLQTANFITNVPTHVGQVYDLHFSLDSQYLAVAFILSNGMTFRIYRTSDWRIVGETPLITNARACRFNDDGSRLAIGSLDDPKLLIYDFQSWLDGITSDIQLIPDMPDLTIASMSRIEWCPGKDLMAISAGTVYNTNTWTSVFTFSSTQRIIFSPNGEFLVINSNVYETTTWTLVYTAPTSTTRYSTFTEDSAYFLISKSSSAPNWILVIRTSDWTNAEGNLISPSGHVFQGPDLSEISGTISDFNATFYENTNVRLFHRGTGKIIAEKQSNAQGEFSFIYPFNGEFYTIALCPENELGHLVFNDSIIRGIT